MAFTSIDRYQIKKGLGQGTSGSVFLASDPKMGRDVAIKILQEDFARNQKHRERFEREAKAIAALSHPNIVDIYDFGGSPDKYLYLVMELIPGPHIGAHIQQNAPVPESTLVAIGLELSHALAHAHEMGIIHRDLKPGNVFLHRGRLVLADFGIAKAITEDSPLGPNAAKTTEVIGTPGFMAPEQLQGHPLDEKADIFAFGALLYYLATQLLPFDAESPYQLLNSMRETRPTPVADLRPEISKRFSHLIQKCISCDQEMRPESMTEIHEKLSVNLKHLGGGDSRKLLAEFETNPIKFKRDAHAKTVRHLIDQLKIAVRDKNADFARILEKRLAILAPQNDDVRRMTDVARLLSGIPKESTPELAYATFKQKRRFFGLGLLACIILGLLVWKKYDQPAPPEPVTKVTKASPIGQGILSIQSQQISKVFLNGRALGSTPLVNQLKLKVGKHQFEFIGNKNKKLKKEIEITDKATVKLRLDWRRNRVLVSNQ